MKTIYFVTVRDHSDTNDYSKYCATPPDFYANRELLFVQSPQGVNHFWIQWRHNIGSFGI